ncbi:MAG TPA: nitrilase-related carbon-nitrogen hydrolase, partial [Polyangiaceae bacterium]|nr:nitrilase-related carbon-nitrogen hydrolase [Polyangiaceae bacterium]
MTTPKIVRAAAVQLSPVLYSCQGTAAKVCDAIAEARKKGAELVVFPETVLPYYPYFSFIKAPAVMGADHLKLIAESVTVPGPVTAQIGSAAKKAGVVVAIG